MLSGTKEDALKKANSVVLTETTAKKIFGSAQAAAGKLLQPEGNNAEPLLVTAVCADWPENSHFLFDMLLTTAGNPGFNTVDFVNFSAYTYILLNKNSSQKSIEAKFPGIIEKYASGNIEEQFAQTYKQFQANGNGYHYYLQPLKKIHLVSNLERELRPNGSMRAVYIFSIVAVFILLIACINFINLSTARSAERAKEVGIRKTFGSEKRTLVAQFLTESTILSLIGMLLAVGFVALLLPLFNQVSGKKMVLSGFFNGQTVALLLLFTLLTGIIAGLYPAFVLSSFRPIQVLKGRFRSGSYGLALRNGLVIFQFSISVILIICTIVVNTQMKYMTGGQLGFNKDFIIVIERTDVLAEKSKTFKHELLTIPGVEDVSGASALPGTENYFGINWQLMGSREPMTGRGVLTDDRHRSTLGLEMKEGRFFSKDFATDSLAVVLNERAVTELGLKKAVGARLTSPEDFLNGPDGSQYIYTVIGVVKDFHYQSLHQAVNPLVFTNASKFNDVLFMTAVRIKGNNFKNTLEAVEKKWKEFVKERPFHYAFLDKTVEQQYLAEATTQKIFTFFSTLAIFIACIGLLGLAAYATQQRMREISIRKVLGASMGNIVTMLSKDFLKLVLLATILAFPVAWWAMHVWLQDFAYRVNIGWWIFAIAGGLAIIIALATISFQAIKAAMANPVKSLRTE